MKLACNKLIKINPSRELSQGNSKKRLRIVHPIIKDLIIDIKRFHDETKTRNPGNLHAGNRKIVSRTSI